MGKTRGFLRLYDMDLYFQMGCGDWFQVERHWSPEQREALDTVHWDARCLCRKLLQPLFESNPNYRHVKHTTTDSHDPKMLSVSTYHAVLTRMPFYGSSFLQHSTADVSRFALPDGYVLIQPATPINDPGVRSQRDLRAEDWRALIVALDSRDRTGVVLDQLVAEIPSHPRLVNLTGQTTLAESIALLKQAGGYHGIDSCLSVLSTELFPPEDLMIRTPNDHVLQNPSWYYAPQERFTFLYKSFDKPAVRCEPRQPVDKSEVLVQINRDMLIALRVHNKGDVVALSKSRAERLVNMGHAVPHVPRYGFCRETA